MTLSEKLFIAIGLLVCLFGLVVTAGGIINTAESAESQPLAGNLALIFLLGVFPFFCGAWLCRFAWRRADLRRRRDQERDLLILAAKHSGKLTHAEVTMHLPLNAATAQALLDDAHRNGLAEIEVTETGCLLYHFRGIVNSAEKQGAQGF